MTDRSLLGELLKKKFKRDFPHGLSFRQLDLSSIAPTERKKKKKRTLSSIPSYYYGYAPNYAPELQKRLHPSVSSDFIIKRF